MSTLGIIMVVTIWLIAAIDWLLTTGVQLWPEQLEWRVMDEEDYINGA